MLEKWRIKENLDLREEVNLCKMNINVLESMKDWVRVIDKDGNILFMNKAMESFGNVKALEFRCSFEEDIITDDAVIPHSVSLTSLLTNKSFTSEILFLGKEYSVTSSPIFNENGQAFAAVEVFRDISAEVSIRRELFNANRRMVDDIEFSKSIQKQLLPKKGFFNNIEIDYFYRPSEDLSGDMFGVDIIDDDKIAFYICDVVGHGVSASLLTMFIKQNISALLSEGYGIYPNMLLNKLKKKFSELGLSSSVYATLFYGYYSRSKNTMVYANAGHNCMPILMRQNSYEKLIATGFPISDLFLGFDYEETEVKINLGDILVFYTDGLTEITNYSGEEFGVKRFEEAVTNDSTKIIENAVKAVDSFSWGQPDDDMAILLAKVG